MILGPPESVGYLLKNNWRKKPGMVQIPLERILPLMNSFDGTNPEILFDRAARLDRDSISLLGAPPPKFLTDTPMAWWATCRYLGEKQGIELKGVHRNAEEI